MSQDSLNLYFKNIWKSNITQYSWSGFSLVDKIKSDEHVLDVGCGFNEFKPYIKNLIGIDPANDSADVVCAIEDFKSDIKFDVAFCLGSINFGDEENIRNQINCVVNCLKPQARIYWRCNPGLQDHGNKECKDIDFYPWTIEKHIELTDIFKFRLDKVCWDTGNRIYAEWSR